MVCVCVCVVHLMQHSAPHTARHRGSISAEHGLGFKKPQYIYHSKSREAVDCMRHIKKVFDPNVSIGGVWTSYDMCVIPPYVCVSLVPGNSQSIQDPPNELKIILFIRTCVCVCGVYAHMWCVCVCVCVCVCMCVLKFL